ncbi:RmlC-like cupin domain-containing protein [Phyllosticta citribraziliensis]|uniref:RmlC-like cupin domain-containing protein n=1 Tax=Phyllosticta citribraziliensis TaxID=989973 RepID=A0ABR1LM37_9PEZI
MSTIDASLSAPLRPSFPLSTHLSSADATANENATTTTLIRALKLAPHPEGGYFVELDRDARRVTNPFHATYDSGMLSPAAGVVSFAETASGDAKSYKDNAAEQRWTDLTRAASTSIFYLLGQANSAGKWHRNKGRTVHTLIRGRGRYVLIHADEVDGGDDGLTGKARVETFVVGKNVERGERMVWIVDGGKYKASFLLEDEDGCGKSEEGLLISETVVPGFEFADHDFLTEERLRDLVTAEQADELAWLLRKDKPQSS